MIGQRIGYIRVSTIDRHVDRQLEGIPLDRTFIDKASGKDTKRPQLDLMMSYARDGDTVVVHSMDRLTRNLDDLRRIVHTLTDKGVKVEFVKEHLTFTGDDSPMASLPQRVDSVYLAHRALPAGCNYSYENGPYT
jgi:DNA invertase Pin-like site-specific DNA recombinase